MKKLVARIGYAEHNYSAVLELPDEVIVVTHKNFEGIKQAVKDSLDFSKEGHLESGDVVPDWVKDGYEIDYKMEISALLQYFDGILTRSALSRITGINERQLGHYATGHRKPRAKQRERIIEGFHRLGKEFSSVV
jgi:hypothetical protein